MSLILRYEMQENLTQDSSGNSYTLTNDGGVVSFSDPTYGNVAYFNGTAPLELASPPSILSGSSPRTYSVWANIRVFADGVQDLFGHSKPSAEEFRVQIWTPERIRIYNNGNLFYTILQNPLSSDTWFHMGITYDGVSEKLYIDGSHVASFDTTFAFGAGELFLGASPRYFPNFGIDGYLSDFRYYDDALSAADVNLLYTEGPNPSPPVIPLAVTPRPLSVNVTISEIDGATYRLTVQETGSPTERIVKNNFTDLTQIIRNLVPETEYTLRLYAKTSNIGYELVHEVTASTRENLAQNYVTDDFSVESGRFDLRELDAASIGSMSSVMDDIFTTGDTLDISVPGGRGEKVSTFINRGANVTIADSEALVAPFTVDAGSGQSVSLTLSDSSVVTLLFDETDESVTVGTTAYNSGDSFVLDGKKATIIDI